MSKLPTGIYEVKSKHGIRYYAWVHFRGRRIHVPKGGWKTQREAKEARVAFYNKLLEGYIEPSKMKFRQFTESIYIPDYANNQLNPAPGEKRSATLTNMYSRRSEKFV
jgi:hypothetical protein